MGGIVTLSIELELGWGMHDKQEYGHLSRDRSAETTALERLLDFADRLEIPITFNVVGHLFHDSCSGTHSGPHPPDWWNEDPGTDIETDPLFYAPDLIFAIRDRQIRHEIATHTYSHLLASKSSDEELNEELTKVTDLHRKFGLNEPASIVMPRHQMPNYSVLAEHGIRVIRTPVERYRKMASNPFSKMWWLLTRDHPSSNIQERAGLLETTVTPHPSLTSVTLPTGQSKPHPAFCMIPKKIRQILHRRYLINTINRAAEDDVHVHLWTHVYNFTNESQWKPMSAGLNHLARKRNEGAVRIQLMEDLPISLN